MTVPPLYQQDILLAGFGQLGQGLAQRLKQANTVYALQRSLPPAEIDGVHRLQNDLLLEPSRWQPLPNNIDYVVIALSPSGRDDAAYQAIFDTGLTHLLTVLSARAQIKHLLFVSSTSVYHQNDGSWVTELSPTHPNSFSGQRLLAAEKKVLDCPFPASVVRFSGIYGGQRLRLLQQIIEQKQRPTLPARLSNRIHESDCIGSLEHLLNLAASGRTLETCYLASDDTPVSLNEVIAFIREQAGLPALEPQAGERTPRRGGDKRCDNSRLKQSGYCFKYPSFREGYAEQMQRHSEKITQWLAKPS